VLRTDETPELPREARLVDELYLNRDGQNHGNLIKVLKHDWLPTVPYIYYIDMELCDFDMHKYITGGDGYVVREDRTPRHLRGKRGPYDIVHIAKQLASGIEFIHGHKKVHRDLKPANSISIALNVHLNSSPLFTLPR